MKSFLDFLKETKASDKFEKKIAHDANGLKNSKYAQNFSASHTKGKVKYADVKMNDHKESDYVEVKLEARGMMGANSVYTYEVEDGIAKLVPNYEHQDDNVKDEIKRHVCRMANAKGKFDKALKTFLGKQNVPSIDTLKVSKFKNKQILKLQDTIRNIISKWYATSIERHGKDCHYIQIGDNLYKLPEIEGEEADIKLEKFLNNGEKNAPEIKKLSGGCLMTLELIIYHGKPRIRSRAFLCNKQEDSDYSLKNGDDDKYRPNQIEN